MDSTMTICDSVATCVNKTAEICQPCVRETETSNNDVTIVVIICGTILLLAIIAVIAYLIQKYNERKAIMNASIRNREYEEKDREYKQRAELLNKLLNIEETLMKKESAYKLEENACKRYIKELKDLITKNTLSENDQETQITTATVR